MASALALGRLPALAFACSLCLTAGLVEAAAVTPVQKVVALLEKLETQVEQEGKGEAAAYDKYACFCKEQVDNKLYAIERSTAKIEKLDARITELGGEISSLEGEINDLGQKITGLETDMTNAKSLRDGEHETFLTNAADADGAIDACRRALDALRESKAALGGKTELEADALAQIKAMTGVALAIAPHMALSRRNLAQLNSLVAVVQPGKAYEYKYHANEIIATIQSLLASFQKTKLNLEQDEFDANSEFEKRQLSMSNEKKFAEKAKLEKEALAEAKREEKEAATADMTQETNEKISDHNFMGVLKVECEDKATLWDQRSRSRSQELTAISEAMTALKTGVAPNWKANKKLVGLQKRADVSKDHAKGYWVPVDDAAHPPQAVARSHAASFLQIRGSGLRGGALGAFSAAQAVAARKIHALLLSAAHRLGSPILSAAALKVSVAEDHFVKVRQIIKDLVARLEADALAEQTEKSFCDESMANAIEKRDSEQSKVEDFMAQISAKESDKAQLNEEVAELSKQIAALKKALMEATDLRQAENAENEKTVTEAGVGKEAVEYALQVLKQYYEGTGSLIQRSSFVPTNSDREGKTVADLAPEVFDADYNGSQEASKGIMGLLEVILSDFDRTGTTVTSQEQAAVEDYNEFKMTNEDDTQTKEGAVEQKETQISQIEDDLVALKDSLNNAKKLHEEALSELNVLHKRCVAGVETYEERVANREKEIAALKEAHDILENWQS